MSKIILSNNNGNKTSDYFRQFAVNSSFFNLDSWVILSNIEQSIKAKIEAVGTPLKDWNINIYRGILTGYNDAFIIDGKKKDELIAEDPKSAEIIRPILRGRDIKRYGYDFADLWLINSHNGIKEKSIKPVNINDYPAIKNHLDQFYSQLKIRTDKGDSPYNLRNCAYMEDFFRPKIIYPEITKFINFYYDENNFLLNNKCFILTGKYIYFLISFFNSSLFKYCFIENFPELMGGTRELRKIFLEKIPIIQVNEKVENQFKTLVINLQQLKKDNQSSIHIEIQIDKLIFDLYNLSEDERREIGFIEIQ